MARDVKDLDGSAAEVDHVALLEHLARGWRWDGVIGGGDPANISSTT